MLNAPIIPGRLGVRAVLSGKHLGGFSEVPPLGLKNANKADVLLGRVKVLFQPTDRLSILGSFWRYEVDQDFTNRLDDNDPPTDVGYAPGESPTDYTLYTLRVGYDLGWADFVSASGYIKRGYGIVLKGCQIELCYDLDTTNPTKAFHQEIRLSSKGDSPLRWIGGLFYMDATNRSLVDFDITPPIVPSPTQAPPLNTQSQSQIQSREIAAFGEVSYDLLGGMLRPLVGLRYSRVKRDRQEISVVKLQGTTISDVDEKAQGTSYHISPRFNLSYFPTPEGMIYINVAEGYRPGALQTASQVAALQAVLGLQTATQLQTDALWSYEVGAKWALFDHSLNIAVAAYMSKWNRAQLQTGLSGTSGILNVGDIDGKGLEVFISHRTPIPGLRWQLAAGVNSTKLKDIEPTILAGLKFLHNGIQLPPVPKASATLMVSYERPLDYYDASLIADARYTYQSRTQDLSTGRTADKLNLFSAAVGLRKDNFVFQVFGENLANDDGPTIWEQGRIIMPRPRTIGVRFSFDGF
jgi:outer membrane receptor protein involved in Fe transport